MSEKRIQDKAEEEMKAYFAAGIPESEIINKKMEEAYQEVREMQHQKRKSKKIKALAFAACAAVICSAAVTYCVKNPSLAAWIPFIGHIFESLEQEVSYPGNYSENAVVLLETTDEQETGIKKDESGYYAESKDMAVTVSEVTYDSNAIYLAVLAENKNGFSQHAQNDNLLYLNCQVDLYQADGSKKTFSDANGNGLAYKAEGEFADANTFKGIIQLTAPELEISAYTTCDITILEFKQELTTGETVTGVLPESGEEVSYIEYDWQIYTGDWKFHFDIGDVSDKKQEIFIGQVNEQGFGIEKIVKTQYELYAVPIYPEGEDGTNYVIMIWDADGVPLDEHGSNLDIKSIYGRDISKITIYLLKEEDFFESKGNNFYLQPQKAAYMVTIDLP